MIYNYWFSRDEILTSMQKIRLINVFGNAKNIYKADIKNVAYHGKIEKSKAKTFEESRKNYNAEKQFENFRKLNMNFKTINDKEYPLRLKEIYDPPYAIFYYGDLSMLKLPCVSIVGARKCTEYGRIIADKLSTKLARANIVVVSGLAEGIDSFSHAGALREKGKTCAVLGCGVDICYPHFNKELYKVIKQRGLLLSEFPPSSKPLGWHFPMRNRIISALSDRVIVVEAKKKSGSLITADMALEQGKDIYAVPGRIFDPLSEGCNKLISQGAGVLDDIDDFVNNLDIKAYFGEEKETCKELALEKEEMLVYSCLKFHPMSLEEILDEEILGFEDTLRVLASLEIKGYIREVFKNQYVSI